jgi:leader peptidase (prepilin peptidase) / N-methyltransferase
MLETLGIEIAVIVFIFGAMIGSFLNVVIYRIPKGESIVFPASKCQSCEKPLKWWHNVPIFSWLFLRGKCYFCKDKISAQYPIVEFLTASIFVVLYFKLGLVWYLPFVAASFAALLALIMIDFDYRAVPDNVNFAAFIFAFIPLIIELIIQLNSLTTFSDKFSFTLLSKLDYYPIVYAIVAPLTLLLIGLLSSFIAQRPAMGGADVIIAGTMGALLGFPNFFVALFLSAILGLIPALINRYYGDDEGVPFIPFLALATFIVYLYDAQATQLLETIIYG